MIAVFFTALVTIPVAEANILGANKFDLLMQYEGFAGWTGDGSPKYRHVTHAMGKKAILDAEDAGFRFFRVSVSGFGGTGPYDVSRDMLLLWQSDPEIYWHRVDQMFDDLDAAGLRIIPTIFWNCAQFAALTGQTTSDFIGEPASASRGLAIRYLRDFVTRYRARKTILFYELTNEFNLYADLDEHRRCLDTKHDAALCVSVGNFTEAQLDSFANDMITLIHQLDPGRQVSSGYGVPQPWAYHMSLNPEWTHRGGFTRDSHEEFARNIEAIHHQFDIVSIHVYPQTKANRFGRLANSQAELIADAADIAHADHKKIFLGEFGDSGPTPFMRSVKALIDTGKVDYAAVWIWEFYQTSTFETFNTGPTKFNIEPGFRDSLIDLLRQPMLRAETPAPRVVLTWPLPCARIDGPIQITATASDGAGSVQKVEFFADGALIDSVSTPPYRSIWSPLGLADHLVRLSVIADTSRGTTATDQTDVRLQDAGEVCRVPD